MLDSAAQDVEHLFKKSLKCNYNWKAATLWFLCRQTREPLITFTFKIKTQVFIRAVNNVKGSAHTYREQLCAEALIDLLPMNWTKYEMTFIMSNLNIYEQIFIIKNRFKSLFEWIKMKINFHRNDMGKLFSIKVHCYSLCLIKQLQSGNLIFLNHD